MSRYYGDNHIGGTPLGGGRHEAPNRESAVERARRDARPRLSPEVEEIVEAVSEVLACAEDTATACEAAVDRVDDAGTRHTLRELMTDYDRHIAALSEVLRSLGLEPAEESEWRRTITRGRLALADIAGDRAVLRALLDRIEVTEQAYRRALRHRGLPEPIRAILRNGDGDCELHRRRVGAL